MCLGSAQQTHHYWKAACMGLQVDGMRDSSEGLADSQSDLIEGWFNKLHVRWN